MLLTTPLLLITLRRYLFTYLLTKHRRGWAWLRWSLTARPISILLSIPVLLPGRSQFQLTEITLAVERCVD